MRFLLKIHRKYLKSKFSLKFEHRTRANKKLIEKKTVRTKAYSKSTRLTFFSRIEKGTREICIEI